MKSGLKREEWIEKVLQSAEDIASVEVNPYLYQRVLARLNKATETVSRKVLWATAMGIVLLIVINVAAIRQTSNGRQPASDASILVQDYHLNDEPLLTN